PGRAHCAVPEEDRARDVVQLAGRDARPHPGLHRGQRLGHDPAGGEQALDVLAALDRHLLSVPGPAVPEIVLSPGGESRYVGGVMARFAALVLVALAAMLAVSGSTGKSAAIYITLKITAPEVIDAHDQFT